MNGKLLQLRPAAGVDDLGDEALAAACATGDHAAQSLLFERHVDAVYRFIARMRGSDTAAVDDIVQATFIAAFQSAGQFRGEKLQSWLFGIAANVLRSYVRREVARKRIATELADEPAPERVVTDSADVEKLRTAIAALPRKLREVLVLVDLEGESGASTAAALRISEGTVWRRLADARAALRDALGGSR
ncbi:MAG: RNA polymerase sigma factor [Deltaproteobacteria bacterium]|nr:RNA polymerase sigma factor [Deltaproteobacteria bacterium]